MKAEESRSKPSQQKGEKFILRCSATVGYTRYAISTTIERTFSGGCTIEGYIRGTEMSKQSVFRSQFSRGVLRSEFAEQDLDESFTKKISQSALSVN
jgi:hypothetical protein